MYPYDETDTDAHEQQHKLQRLVEDPLYWREQDPEFRTYVDGGFKAVYGNEEAERDATGRTLDPAPRPVTLPPFEPSVQPDDVNLAGGVGENQPNRWRDVWNVQNGLADTGHYALDLTNEKSGEHSPVLGKAIRDFQREKREEIDGTLLPGGPTITRLKESLFGRGPIARQIEQKHPLQSSRDQSANPLISVLGPLFAPSIKPAAPGTRALAPRPDTDSADVIPAQAPGSSLPPTGPQPRRTHREAEAESERRSYTYRINGLPDQMRYPDGPFLHDDAERRDSIVNDTPGRISVAEGPFARSAEPWNAVHYLGRRAVRKHDATIEREAARLDVDPDLVRAVMYVENAQGWYGYFPERFGLAKSILPMNIRPALWSALGFAPSDFDNPELNIRAGVMLIRRILERLDQPTVSKPGTLYNSLSQDRVLDYGARVSEVYRTKPWRQ